MQSKYIFAPPIDEFILPMKEKEGSKDGILVRSLELEVKPRMFTLSTDYYALSFPHNQKFS